MNYKSLEAKPFYIDVEWNDDARRLWTPSWSPKKPKPNIRVGVQQKFVVTKLRLEPQTIYTKINVRWLIAVLKINFNSIRDSFIT